MVVVIKKLFLLIMIILYLSLIVACQPLPSSISGNITVKHNLINNQINNKYIMNTKITTASIKNTSEAKIGELIIGFYEEIAEKERQEILEELELIILNSTPLLNSYLVKVEANELEEKKRQALNYPQIRYVEPNYIVTVSNLNLANDLDYEKQWNYPLIRLPQAWNITTGSNSVRIAVLDTGVDMNHSDLSANLNINEGYNFINMNRDVQDKHDHGTHVAGIIGAVTNNSQGIAGVMWEVDLLPIKVLNDQGGGDIFQVVEGILYAAGLDNDSEENIAAVDVINLSLGIKKNEISSNNNTFLHDAIKAAVANDVLIVAAAGNYGTDTAVYPAAYPEVIAVGGINNELEIPKDFYKGSYLDILAPGVNIYSTIPENDYGIKSGTSMAAPHVTGVIGLMLAKGIPKNEVRSRIKRTSMLMEDGDFGLINAYWAVKEVNHLQVLVGTLEGNEIKSVAQTSLPLQGGNFQISPIPSESYRVFAWIDIEGNGRIEVGDYFAMSKEITFEKYTNYFGLDGFIVEIENEDFLTQIESFKTLSFNY